MHTSTRHIALQVIERKGGDTFSIFLSQSLYHGVDTYRIETVYTDDEGFIVDDHELTRKLDFDVRAEAEAAYRNILRQVENGEFPEELED